MQDREFRNLASRPDLVKEVDGSDGTTPYVNLVQIRLVRTRKVVLHAHDDLPLWPGDRVAVETERGSALGVVLTLPVKLRRARKNLRSVIRILTDRPERGGRDRTAWKEDSARQVCRRLVNEMSMDMKVIEVEYIPWENRTVFYFVSEGRVDFRDLVKELSRSLRCRIEMRQIGPRDETKMLGGLSRCGREHCCSTFLSEFRSVRTKMAKEQGLVVNQEKITGHCRKLLCCLGYERDVYAALRKDLPPLGARVQTADGNGKVVELMILRQEVKVYFEETNSLRILSARELTVQEHGDWVREDATSLLVQQDDLDPASLRELEEESGNGEESGRAPRSDRSPAGRDGQRPPRNDRPRGPRPQGGQRDRGRPQGSSGDAGRPHPRREEGNRRGPQQGRPGPEQRRKEPNSASGGRPNESAGAHPGKESGDGGDSRSSTRRRHRKRPSGPKPEGGHPTPGGSQGGSES